METDIRYHEPSAPACEREMAASAEQWSNWTTNEIRSAIEAERERTFELLTELLVGIKKGPDSRGRRDAARATRPGRAGGAHRQAADRQGVAARDGLLRRLCRDLRWRQLSSASRHRRAARQRGALDLSRRSWSRC